MAATLAFPYTCASKYMIPCHSSHLCLFDVQCNPALRTPVYKGQFSLSRAKKGSATYIFYEITLIFKIRTSVGVRIDRPAPL